MTIPPLVPGIILSSDRIKTAIFNDLFSAKAPFRFPQKVEPTLNAILLKKEFQYSNHHHQLEPQDRILIYVPLLLTYILELEDSFELGLTFSTFLSNSQTKKIKFIFVPLFIVWPLWPGYLLYVINLIFIRVP